MRPHVVAKKHDVCGTLAIVLGVEVAAANRMRAEHGKQIPRNAGAEISFRLPAAVGNRQASSADCGDGREDRVRFFPVAHVEVRQAGLVVGLRLLLAEDENAIRIGIRIGLSRTPSIRLKIVAFRPMPNPRQRMATVAKPLLRERLRRA